MVPKTSQYKHKIVFILCSKNVKAVSLSITSFNIIIQNIFQKFMILLIIRNIYTYLYTEWPHPGILQEIQLEIPGDSN